MSYFFVPSLRVHCDISQTNCECYMSLCMRLMSRETETVKPECWEFKYKGNGQCDISNTIWVVKKYFTTRYLNQQIRYIYNSKTSVILLTLYVINVYLKFLTNYLIYISILVTNITWYILLVLLSKYLESLCISS